MGQVRVSAVLLAFAASVAHAQSQSAVDEAKQHFKNGAEMYDENNFRGALVEFQRAYELSPSYKILFNIGQVDMELQDYAGALKAYTRYLREGGPDVPKDRADDVAKEIERLKGRVGYLSIQTPAGAEILVDDASVGYAPLPEPVTVNAGRHTVTVHISGREPMNRVTDVAGQQTLTVAIGNDLVTPPPQATPAAAQPKVAPKEPEGPPSKTPMYVAWGATGALAVGAGVFAWQAHTDSNDLAKLRATYPVTAQQLSDQKSKTQTAAMVTDILTGGAVVAGGIALYLTLTHSSDTHERSAHLMVSPTGAMIAGHF